MSINTKENIRKGLLKDSPEIEEATEELMEKFETDLEVVTLKYGREDVVFALRNIYREFTQRRYINPYPIPEDQFEGMAEATRGEAVHIGNATPEEAGKIFVEEFRDLPVEQRNLIRTTLKHNGDHGLYAWVDLLIPDNFYENRDKYVTVIVADLLDEIRS